MKRNLKKIVTVILAMVMVMAMALPAMATNPNNNPGRYNLMIKTVANHTYKIYQLATGDVSADGEKLSNIKVGSEAKGGVTTDMIVELVKDKKGTELSDAATFLINQTKEPTAKIVGDGTERGVNLPGGYYVIIDTYTDGHQPGKDEYNTESLSRVMVTLVKDTTMTPKDSTITPDKKIVEDDHQELDTNEASIGDTILYKLSGTIPDMHDYEHFRFVFVDTMSKGLTPTKNISVGAELEGLVGDKTAKFKVTAVDKQEDVGTIIRIALMNAINYKDQKGAEVVVHITATLNEYAVVAGESNPNTVHIEFSNNTAMENSGEPGDDFGPDDPKGKTPEIEVKTYTTQLTITKRDGDGEVLTGAEFELKGAGVNVGYVTGQEYVEYGVEEEDIENNVWYKLVDGAYTQTAPTDGTANKYADTVKKYKLQDVEKKVNSDYVSKAFVGSDGNVIFTGLGAGTYTLTETTTPDGYNTIKPITFTVSWTEEGGFSVAVTEPSDGSVNISVAGKVDNGLGIGTTLSTQIVNQKGAKLPSTGGMGTTILYVIGICLVVAAGVLLVTRKRVNKNR